MYSDSGVDEAQNLQEENRTKRCTRHKKYGQLDSDLDSQRAVLGWYSFLTQPPKWQSLIPVSRALPWADSLSRLETPTFGAVFWLFVSSNAHLRRS